jgi:hypothetical protein
MADYRDMAAALSGGYGQDTGGITPDTLITLKNGKKATASDLLGMIKGYGQAVGSNLESLGRGGVASVIGAGGDLESFGRMGINKLYGAGGVNVSETPVLPTSTDILGMMPRGTATRPETAGMEELGGYMTPATAKVLKPAVTGYAKLAGQEINAGLTGQPTRSLLGDITPKPKLLDVYHGTPHTLPPTERNPLGEFDASKIGTGEGAQAYGYGIYTAQNPAVAKEYQFMQQNWFDTSKAKYKGKSIDTWYEQAQKDQERAFKTNNKALEKDATARLAYWENIMTHNHPENVLKQFTDPEYGWDAATNYAKSIDLGKFEGIPRTGNLYKVDLPDEMIPKMIDYDKTWMQQPESVRNAIDISGLLKYYNAEDLPTSQVFYHAQQSMNPAQFAEFLKSKGIPGIKYLDEGSRTKGEGTRNFVVFPGEEKNMIILERNAEKITK